MKEIEVGETILYKGRILMAREASGYEKCAHCGLYTDRNRCYKYACTSKARHDGRTIFFEEVERVMREIKIGEPFEYEGKPLIAKAGDINSCRKCAFDDDTEGCHSFLCTPSGRQDGNWAYFEEVKDE